MVAWQNGEAIPVPIQDVVAQSPLHVNPQGSLVQSARCLGIYVGEKT